MIPSRACLELLLHADWGLSSPGTIAGTMKVASHKYAKIRWATETLKMHQGMQEKSWSHRSGKKNDGGRQISANLINVPDPMNSNAKGLLTVETM